MSANTASTTPRETSVRRDFATRLFGHDVFISFALGPPPRGSLSYASDLARRLRERDFTVFLSEDEAAPGEHLDTTLRKALHGSRTLVVIANRGTLAEPRWVRTEVESFRGLIPERPVIPISIGGALQDPGLAEVTAQWLPFADKIWLDEVAEACESGVASAAVVDRLTLAPHLIRSNVKWRWLVRAIGATLLGLVVALGIAAKLARDNERIARAGERAAQATASLSQDPDLAVQQALASLDTVVTAEGERVLRRAVQESSLIAVFDAGCVSQSAEFGVRGKYVMSRCADGSARVWDSATAQSVMNLAGARGEPLIAQWAADESAVYVAALDGALRMLAVPGGDELMRLPSNGAPIRGMVVNPSSGQLLVWRAGDGLRAYALSDLAPQWHNAAPANDVRWVKASQDGTELAVLWPDPAHDGLGSVRYFDARDGRQLADLGGKPEIYQRGSVFDSEGRRMLRLGDDEISEHWNVLTWDVRAGRRLAELERPAGRFWTGAIDEQGGVYIGYWGNVVQIWLPDTPDGARRPWVELTGHSGSVVDIDLRKLDGETFVLTASADGTARLWKPIARQYQQSSVGDPSELRVLRGHRGAVTMARFSPDGDRALTVGVDGTARVWRLEPNHLGSPERGSLLSLAANADGDAVRSIPVDAAWRRFVLQEGQRLRVVERDGDRVVCDLDTQSLGLVNPKAHLDGGGQRLLLVHEQGKRAVLFDLRGCRELRHFVLPGDGPPLDVSFNATATAALLRFGEYHVIDLDAGRELGVLLGAQHVFEPAAFVGDKLAVLALDAWGEHLVQWGGPPYGQGRKLELPFAVKSIVMSPDRRVVAAAGRDRTALIDAATGAVLHKWPVQPFSLAFSADGSRLVAHAEDDNIRVWSVREGTTLLEMLPHAPDGLRDIDLSSDGQRVLSNAGVWSVEGGQRLDVQWADTAPWIDGLWFLREKQLDLKTVRSVHRCVTCESLQTLRVVARLRLARHGRQVAGPGGKPAIGSVLDSEGRHMLRVGDDRQGRRMGNIPVDLKYLESHEWARLEADGTVTVGISDHAQHVLGDLVFVEVPEVGRTLTKGGAAAVLESVIAASDVYSPVSGEVIAANTALSAAPELINQGPYADGWIFRVKPSNHSELSQLLDAAAYGRVVEAD